MAKSLLERLRARGATYGNFSLYFPEELTIHYQLEPEAVVLTGDRGEPLSQSDWEQLKALVDVVYAAAPGDEIVTMFREARELEHKRVLAGLNTRQPKPVKPGYVYLIKSEQGRFKIGYTVNLNSRLAALSTASPYNLQLVCAFKSADPKALEARLHERFAPLRKRGEWFELTPEQVEWLRSFDGGQPDFEGGGQ